MLMMIKKEDYTWRGVTEDDHEENTEKVLDDDAGKENT